MNSILQGSRTRCYLCGKFAGFYEPLDEHHVFGGTRRGLSEKYGLKVYLHHSSCHIFGEKAVHKNAETDWAIKQQAQKAAMERYNWSIDDFISVFGKNYLD